MNRKLNEAPILDQLDGHWQKMVCLLLSKMLKKGESVTITLADMEKLKQDMAGRYWTQWWKKH